MNNHAKYIGSESNFQITCAGYLDSTGAVWFHTPNETMGTKAHYRKRALMGVKSGVPDIMILDQRHGFNGLAIELKVGRNKQSENQIFWEEKLTKCGWKYITTYSLDEFIQIVDDYYSI